MSLSVPWVGVIVATLVGFMASFLWFNQNTFFPVWWRAMGKGDEQPGDGQSMGLLFGLALLSQLALAIVTAVVLGGWTDGDASLTDGLITGLMLGVAAAGASLGHRLFAGQGLFVWVLEVGSDVLNLALMGMVLSLWI